MGPPCQEWGASLSSSTGTLTQYDDALTAHAPAQLLKSLHDAFWYEESTFGYAPETDKTGGEDCAGRVCRAHGTLGGGLGLGTGEGGGEGTGLGDGLGMGAGGGDDAGVGGGLAAGEGGGERVGLGGGLAGGEGGGGDSTTDTAGDNPSESSAAGTCMSGPDQSPLHTPFHSTNFPQHIRIHAQALLAFRDILSRIHDRCQGTACSLTLIDPVHWHIVLLALFCSGCLPRALA